MKCLPRHPSRAKLCLEDIPSAAQKKKPKATIQNETYDTVSAPNILYGWSNPPSRNLMLA